jgi:hypothetical protein
VRWFVRSVADHETHLGCRDGTRVQAVCGQDFPITALTVALPGLPPDPQQVCPSCRDRTAGGPANEVKQ